MLNGLELKRAYKAQVKWSEQNNDMQAGNDRFLDMIINKAIAREDYEEERQKKLDRFRSQPKRGKKKEEEQFFEKTRAPKM